MKTNVPVLCVEDLNIGLQRIDGCRSQPVQARKIKQEWRKSGSNNGGKAKRTGRGRNRRAGKGVGGGGPPEGHFRGCGIKRWGIKGIRIGTSGRFGRGRGEF